MTPKRRMWLSVGSMAVGLAVFCHEMIRINASARFSLFVGALGLGVVLLYLRELLDNHLPTKKVHIDVHAPIDVADPLVTCFLGYAKSMVDTDRRDALLHDIVVIWGSGFGFSARAISDLPLEIIEALIRLAEKEPELKERYWIDLLRQRRDQLRVKAE